MLFRLIEPREVEHLVGIASTAETVKANFDAVRDKHPFRAGRIDGVIPGLLHRATSTPRHDLVEVVSFWAFQFERGNDVPGGCRLIETAKRRVHGTATDLLLYCERVGVGWIER